VTGTIVEVVVNKPIARAAFLVVWRHDVCHLTRRISGFTMAGGDY
jgi:hypothetical protein